MDTVTSSDKEDLIVHGKACVHLGPGSHWVTRAGQVQTCGSGQEWTLGIFPRSLCEKGMSLEGFFLLTLLICLLFHLYLFYSCIRERDIQFFFFWPRSTYSASWQTWYDPTYETQFYQLILFSQHHFPSSLIPSFLTTFTFKPDLKGQGGLDLCKPCLNPLSFGSSVSLNRSFSLSFLIVKRE